ncbi:MAG: hypothetical protein IJ584_17055, partial [Bacteroidales bacterium]|nr:hypothetical protein [Bacteroidales bacterium]
NTGYIRQMTIGPDGKFYFGTEIHYFSFDPVSEETENIINCYGYFTNEIVDSRGDLWLSSGRETVYRYSLSGGKRTLKASYRANNDVTAICEDTGRNVWIFTSNSAMYITPDGREVNFGKVRDLENATVPVADRSSRRIFINTPNGKIYECNIDGVKETPFPVSGLTCALTSSDGSIWLGTSGDGLYRYSPADDAVTLHLREGESLLDGNIRAILEDSRGNIWFSTSNYITRYDVRGGEVGNIYDSVFEKDGFYEVGNAAVDSEGNLYFGGNVGITKIDPQSQVMDLSSEEGRLMLQEVIVGGENLQTIPPDVVLPRNRNNVSFRFVAPKYGSGPKMNYAFMLEHLDPKWNFTSENTATYNNLRPGRYNFKVTTVRPDGEMDPEAIVLPLRIRPSLAGSPVAVTLYILFALALAHVLFSLLVRSRTQQERIRLIEAREDLRQEQMDFMTNISHEFRTPLSLVYGPLKQLLGSDTFHPKDKAAVELMEKNVLRLKDLSEKILEVSSGKMGDRFLKVSLHRPGSFLSDLSESFRYLSSQKEISFSVESPQDAGGIYFDRDKVEKICYNLLSNAFKYTPEHGEVSLTLSIDGDGAHFVVRDNGIGVPEQMRDKV